MATINFEDLLKSDLCVEKVSTADRSGRSRFRIGGGQASNQFYKTLALLAAERKHFGFGLLFNRKSEGRQKAAHPTDSRFTPIVGVDSH